MMDFDLLKRRILQVNKGFYDRIYKDPWLKQVFQVVPQEHIEMQQTDFMLGALGGPKKYCGRSPADAHPHIYVDEEMWQLRETYLKEAFVETGFPEELRSKWLKVDEAFKRVILKKDFASCKKRFTMDEIIYFPSSTRKKAG